MKIKYIILSIGVLFFFCSLEVSIADKRDRKISKFIKKSYDCDTIKKEEISIPDSLKQFDENRAFKLSNGDSTIGYLLFNRALGCRIGGCSPGNSPSNPSNHDPYYFATIYDANLTIREIRVLEYYSEQGFEITSRRWLKQFVNKFGCNLRINKEIDGITGATISVNSMINEVNRNCKLINTLIPLN